MSFRGGPIRGNEIEIDYEMRRSVSSYPLIRLHAYITHAAFPGTACYNGPNVSVQPLRRRTQPINEN